MKNYILDAAGEPVVADLMTWAAWFEKAERHVAEETRGDVRVSTIFLGVDHSFGMGPPVLWETMIFGGPEDEYQTRYTSRADAVAGHATACALAFDLAHLDAATHEDVP